MSQNLSPSPLAAVSRLPWSRASRRRGSCPGRSQGFSLVEVSIVTAIILIVSIIGIPAINGYVIENKVPEVAGELQRYVARTKANGQGTANPYADIDTSHLGRSLRGSSVVAVDAATFGRVAHGLGGNGTSTGLITVAASDGGASFTLTLDAVNDAACPALSSLLQRIAERIEIGGAGNTMVKDARAATPLAYSPLAAQEACRTGDLNTFAFTVW
ncbi:MAG: type 4 pilus major pilin [Pigmentiphaga sp.]